MTLQTSDTSATQGLERIGQPAVAALVEALQSPNKTVRRHAAFALGKIGDAAALEPLLDLCHREHMQNRVGPTGMDNDVLEPASVSAAKILFPDHAADQRWLADRVAAVSVATGGGYLLEWERKPEVADFWKRYRHAHPTPFTALEDLDESFRAQVMDAAWNALPPNQLVTLQKNVQDSPERAPYIRLDAIATQVANFQYTDAAQWQAAAERILGGQAVALYRAQRQALIQDLARRGPAGLARMLAVWDSQNRSGALRGGWIGEVAQAVGAPAMAVLQKGGESRPQNRVATQSILVRMGTTTDTAASADAGAAAEAVR